MENNNPIINANEILCISFNQDYTYMSLGTEKGFIIYKTNPFQQKLNRGKIYNY